MIYQSNSYSSQPHVAWEPSNGETAAIVSDFRQAGESHLVVFADEFFSDRDLLARMGIKESDWVHWVSQSSEPSTDLMDSYVSLQSSWSSQRPSGVVGLGGGSTLDIAKAFAVMWTNPGTASSLQGRDLPTVPALPKIGIPTLPGTGSEATRTAVLINPSTNLKLGINSNFTAFDVAILDWKLSQSAPREQSFYTLMDTFFHSIEILRGSKRHLVADSYAGAALSLVREVLENGQLLTDSGRKRATWASFLGGLALNVGTVGLVHPLSAGIGTVLGIPHGLANCLAFSAFKNQYEEEYEVFLRILKANDINLPYQLIREIDDESLSAIVQSASLHETPIKNFYGANWKSKFNLETIRIDFGWA